MKKNEKTFYQWLKSATSVNPSNEVDNRILLIAKQELHAPPTNPFYFWIKIALPVGVTALFIFLIKIKSNQPDVFNSVAFTESPEMILNYKQIELMADLGDLSEDEWKKIEEIN